MAQRRSSKSPRRTRGGSDKSGPGLFGGEAASATGPGTITVTELTRLIKGAIQSQLSAEMHLVGELSNFTRSANGHLYFTMKDATAEIRCVMWRSAAATLRFRPGDGLEVIATGAVDVYEPRGQYQFYARKLEPRGVGALELAFRQLKERLAKEGLFDPQRKRELPRFPERIAVVTSGTGAAIRDILQTLDRRYPSVRVFVFDVRVQGDGAADEVADAIRRINRNRERLGGVDVMIVGRGGGSLEDLWAFNEEVVARAICASEIPVVSAVGHEVDFTIADFVADVRAATPTAAAELVVPTRDELGAEINSHAHRMARGMRAALDSIRSRLTAVERFEWFRDPVGRVRHRQQQVDEISGRLQLAISRGMGARKTAVHELEVRLARVRPEAVLSKRRDILTRVEQRLSGAQRQFCLRLERRMALHEGRLAAFSPMRLVEPASVATQQLRARLVRGLAVALSQRGRALESLEARLAAGSHERILARGFSITRLSRSRKIVTDPKNVRTGDVIATQTSEGEFKSRVVDADQPELFE